MASSSKNASYSSLSCAVASFVALYGMMDLPLLAQSQPITDECSNVAPGDLFFRVFNSENPDEFILFALDDIPAAVEAIYVTDKAWNGSEFMGGEGILKYEIGLEGIALGADIGFGPEFASMEDRDRWEEVEGPDNEFFDLSTTGDNMFVFCINADGFPHFIAGLIYNSEQEWQEVGEVSSFGANETVLPQALDDAMAAVALPIYPSYFFQSPPGGGDISKPILLGYYTDPNNWVGSDIRLALPSDPTEPTASPNECRFELPWDPVFPRLRRKFRKFREC